MSPGGQWIPAGSDYGSALTGDGRLFGPNFYDVTGAYIGSEGAGGGAAPPGGWGSGEGFGVMEGFFAEPSIVGDDPSS